MRREPGPHPGKSDSDSTRWNYRQHGPETAAALARSLVAAGGALVGMFLAVRLGALLVAALFTHLGESIVREIMSGGATRGLSGIQGVLVGLFVVIGAFVVALLVVVTLVSLIFLLLPVAMTALALFTSRAGLILRTLWLMLTVIVALAVAVYAATSLLGVRAGWPIWVGILVVGAFLGRMIVELWKPDKAGVRTDASVAVGQWKRVGLVWLALVTR